MRIGERQQGTVFCCKNPTLQAGVESDCQHYFRVINLASIVVIYLKIYSTVPKG